MLAHASKHNASIKLTFDERQQQQLKFLSETPKCSGGLRWHWRNIVPSDREFHASSCIHTSFTLRLECGDVYAPFERHVWYNLCRRCSYVVAIDTTPGDVYALLRPRATFYLSAIALYQMPHSPIYVQVWDVVTYYNTVFAWDTSLAVVFASPLLYFTGLKYTV
jgi:hypothetical protein